MLSFLLITLCLIAFAICIIYYIEWRQNYFTVMEYAKNPYSKWYL